MDIKAALCSFEAVFRCHVSFHDLGPLRSCLALNSRLLHLNSFCDHVKRLGRKSAWQCADFDTNSVRERLHSASAPFFKLCYAGALELVAPIVQHDRLAGVMFVGPFAPAAGWFDDEATLRHPLAKTALHGDLREFRLDEADNLRNMASLLAAGIQNALSADEQAGGASHLERAKLFFDREFARSDLRLEDLAVWLGLSKSRCSQLLRQYFDKGFPVLLAERRMEQLLRETALNTETVGKLCGYPDSPYFFRVFKLQHGGETPAVHRKKNSRPPRQA